MSCRKLSARSAAPHLAVVVRPICDLRLNARNPRQHGPEQIAQLKNSIAIFGFNAPVLIDGSGQVVAGHARIQACLELGWTEVPTICLDHLSKAQARAYMLADNKLAENATWDKQLVGEVLQELSVTELDFSLEAIGFEMGEIDFLIEGAKGARDKAKGPDQADLLPAASEGPAVCRLGDLWQLGPHRVLCGSALEEASYTILMDGAKAAMVFTDPPYNVPIRGHVSGRDRAREFVMGSGEFSIDGFVGFLGTSLGWHVHCSHDGSIHFVCMDWRHMRELLMASTAIYSELKNVCVWAKDNGGMGSLYRSQHELVFVYKAGSAAHRNNVQLGKHGRNRTNVWAHPGANSFARKGEEGNLLALHPTVKPVQLVADAILDCSARGDLVLDGFLGSGTTLIAAERVGRVCYGLELDPLYVDVIIRRWQLLTGGTARHLASGQTFAERLAHAEAGSPCPSPILDTKEQ